MAEKTYTLPDIINRLDHPEFPWAIECVFRTFNELVRIDHNQSWRKILYDGARIIVDFLNARAASIRLHDPHLNQMVSFGSYHYGESNREISIPFEESIAGKVVATQSSQVVEDISASPDYQNKSVVDRGLKSLLAVPLIIPRFVEEGNADIRGTIQVYYGEAPKKFSPVEIMTAELMAQRMSYVIARKRILDLRRVNEKKEWLVEKIFSKLSLDKGIKMKDLFRITMDEFQDIIKVQSCSLFAIADDGETAVIESGWPEQGGYHTIGKAFKLQEHPYLSAAVRQNHPLGDFENERVYPSYLLIKNPQASYLITDNLATFALTHDINSILYVPLRIDDEVRYLLVFDALDKRRFFSDEEIEILIFFGKQLTQALEIERLDEILHDFKNPAIAIAGFARRVKKAIESENFDKESVAKHLDIVIHEGTRLQEMAISLYPMARPEEIDFSELVRERFLINDVAINERKRSGIETNASDLAPGLVVNTWRLPLERVLDNLLNNATKAIPSDGGNLRVRTFKRDGMANLEITNTGCILPEDVAKILTADVSGRGLNIIYRFVRTMDGKIDLDVDSASNSTTFRMSVPLASQGPVRQ